MDSHGVDSDMVMLEDDNKLRKLAKIMLTQEERLMVRITSEPERAKYLKQCNEAYDHVISLLDESAQHRDKHEKKGNEAKADIAKNLHKYILYGINMGMQNVRNCSLRVSCIGKIKTHYKSLIQEIELLDTESTSVASLERLAKDMVNYKNYMWEYTNNSRSGSARAISKAYSLLLKQEGIKFPQLVERHKTKLGFTGEFEILEDAQKLEVYNSIINESGRAKLPKLELVTGTLGVAVLVVAAGLMVWDIYTAEHHLEPLLRNSLSVLSAGAAFAVQVFAEAAVTTAVVEAELGVFVVALAGFVAGSVTGLLILAAGSALIDLILDSGGKVVPNLDGLKFHTAQMPDGMALALQLSRQGN